MSDNKTFAGEFAARFTHKLSNSNFFGIKDAVRDVKDGITGTTAEVAAEYAMSATQEVVEQIKTDTQPIIAQTAEQLNPEQKDTWVIIRNNVAPEGGFLKTIFARLLWVGAKLSSFVGALVVDKWTGRDEKGANQSNIESILAWLLGKTIGSGEPRTTTNTRPLGIPGAWVNTPTTA